MDAVYHGAMKFPLVLLLVSALVPALSAKELTSGSPEPAPDPLDALPGYWQFTHDDPLLGTLAAVGTLANLAPLFVPDSPGSTEYWVERNGLHYFAWTDASSDPYRLTNAALGYAGIWGGFFAVYADWDRDVKTGRTGSDRWSSLDMGDYLMAPFQPEMVFNFDVFPLFPLLELAPLTLDQWAEAGRFFRRGQVDFLGRKVPPALGLGLTVAGAMTLVAANATLEEIAFRGQALRSLGVVGSSVYFGANHLLNPFALPNFSFEEAAQQAGFATLFGLYAASRTEANGGDFCRMIALHYWHNVTTLVLGYLIDPEHAQLFQISFLL